MFSVVLIRSFIDGTTIASTTRIILFSMLVSDLTTGLSSTKLSTLEEARIQIGPHQTLIELGASNVF